MAARARSFETISGIGTLIISRTVPDLSDQKHLNAACPPQTTPIARTALYGQFPNMTEPWPGAALLTTAAHAVLLASDRMRDSSPPRAHPHPGHRQSRSQPARSAERSTSATAVG